MTNDDRYDSRIVMHTSDGVKSGISNEQPRLQGEEAKLAETFLSGTGYLASQRGQYRMLRTEGRSCSTF